MASGSSGGNTCLGQMFMMPALYLRFIFFSLFKQGNAEAGQPERNARNKSGMQNQTNERASIFLSNDIWRKVASHMPTKDWVRASGTCKAMFKVQLSSVDLESSTAAAVVWAARYSRGMESLKMKLYMWSEDRSRYVSAAAYTDDWDLRQLHTLCVSLDPWQSRNTLFNQCAQLLFVPADDRKRWTWLSEMLSSACNVKQLYLKGEGMGGPAVNRCGLPPLKHLTHLGVTTPISPYMSHSFQQLPVLQHLSIGKGPGSQDMEPLLPLDLTGCNALQDLTLENVLPGELTLSPEVKIRLIWQDSPALLESWRGIRNRCTSLKVKGHSFQLRQQLREMFRPACPVLRVLELECMYIGHETFPLVLNLPSLEKVVMVSIDTYVVVGKGTWPREVHIFASNKLELNCGDAAALVAGISVLEYTRCIYITLSTRLLLEHFDDCEVWQKTCEPLACFGHHIICRRQEGVTQA